jgi:hypothetical protein
MITYEWDCSNVEYYFNYDNESDVVYNVNWRLTATSSDVDPDGNNYSAFMTDEKLLDISDLSNFVPFNQLTNQIVTGWVENAYGPEVVQEYKDMLAQQINEQQNPQSAWGKVN